MFQPSLAVQVLYVSKWGLRFLLKHCNCSTICSVSMLQCSASISQFRGVPLFRQCYMFRCSLVFRCCGSATCFVALWCSAVLAVLHVSLLFGVPLFRQCSVFQRYWFYSMPSETQCYKVQKFVTKFVLSVNYCGQQKYQYNCSLVYS